MQLDWGSAPANDRATTIATIESHAAGEPLRIITGGMPELVGDSILERRRYMQENFDHVRRALMWEPRGHYDMYGCVLTPPASKEADLGVLFMHNEGYSTMCGHGVIALVTALLETGAFPARGRETPVNLDTPAGLVRATAHLDERGRVERVSFLNVPSFVLAQDVRLEMERIGTVTADVAFGGAYYAIMPAERAGLSVSLEQLPDLIAAGEAIKHATADAVTSQHSGAADLGFLYGAILTGPPEDPAHHSRNICVFANAEVDRSPTGTGVSARLALHFTRGEIREGEPIAIESIIGASSVFTGRVAGTTTVGNRPAVIPEVSGTAFITGRSEFRIDPSDPLGQGFLVR
jgi:proline racemase